VLSGKVVDKTFNADVKVETANVDKRTMSYLYNDGDSFVFMDTDTYDQTNVSPEVVGMPPTSSRESRGHRRGPRGHRLSTSSSRPRSSCSSSTPSRVCRATVRRAAPSRHDSRRAYEIAVPLFITSGEKVKVDTRDGSYLGRVSS
jgi:elongation factor P